MKQKLKGETAPSSRGQKGFNSAQETQSGVQTEPSRVQEVQKGRSMIEMLGVLAIIGVLSIGGIAGYTQALNRHKANEIVDTISKLCIIARTRLAIIESSKDDADFSDLDIQGPVAGCATNIKVEAGSVWTGEKIAQYCRPKIEGCNNEPGLKSALASLLGQEVNDYSNDSYLYFSDVFDEY